MSRRSLARPCSCPWSGPGRPLSRVTLPEAGRGEGTPEKIDLGEDRSQRGTRNVKRKGEKMRKLMMLATMLAVAMLAASPALAQDEPAVVADAKAKTATAGGAKAEADCTDEIIEAKAGGVVAKASCKPAPPPPPKPAPVPAPASKPAPAPAPAPKAAPAPAPPPPKAAPAPKMKALPPTGGSSVASLLALGAGGLLVGGGLLARRLVRS